ncbi:hypothetical protein [Streptomyces sp. MZ04]|uniref:hypothetical protein n=1 Tax=Streptomyces sp. MZ04 TaxID=2559236 RepID=UPI00107E9AE4|nr:hypothetical protein [Streptomyces sp. MZ04]TGA90494.1 hypothetical protein E2651_38600 [Streptomyces sp. MZ04]
MVGLTWKQAKKKLGKWAKYADTYKAWSDQKDVPEVGDDIVICFQDKPEYLNPGEEDPDLNLGLAAVSAGSACPKKNGDYLDPGNDPDSPSYDEDNNGVPDSQEDDDSYGSSGSSSTGGGSSTSGGGGDNPADGPDDYEHSGGGGCPPGGCNNPCPPGGCTS